MIKFIVQHHKGTTTVREVVVEEVLSQPWEVVGREKRYAILSDSMKEDNGKYPIWYSHSIYDSEALAINAAAGDIRASTKIFNDEEIISKVAAITIKKLENKNGTIK